MSVTLIYFILTLFINYLEFKVSNIRYKKLVYLRVIVFANCEDFKNFSNLPNPPFSRLEYRHCCEIVDQRLNK